MLNKFDRTRLELTRQAPEFDFNSHLLWQVAIEADPGVHFIKKPTNAALDLLLDQEVLRDAVETLAQVEARLGRLEAVFRGDGDGGTCRCGHTTSTLGISRNGYVLLNLSSTTLASLHSTHLHSLIPCPFQYGQNEPGRLLNILGSPAPSTQHKPTVKTLAQYNRRRCPAGCRER
jgi:hypothetical protein